MRQGRDSEISHRSDNNSTEFAQDLPGGNGKQSQNCIMGAEMVCWFERVGRSALRPPQHISRMTIGRNTAI